MKETQCEQVLQYLSSGGTLTPLDALRLFGCNRLAARINDLKRDGHEIAVAMVDVETASGGTAHVACYSMPYWWGAPA